MFKYVFQDTEAMEAMEVTEATGVMVVIVAISAGARDRNHPTLPPLPQWMMLLLFQLPQFLLLAEKLLSSSVRPSFSPNGLEIASYYLVFTPFNHPNSTTFCYDIWLQFSRQANLLILGPTKTIHHDTDLT